MIHQSLLLVPCARLTALVPAKMNVSPPGGLSRGVANPPFRKKGHFFASMMTKCAFRNSV